jgi:hypothetical protein
MELMNAQSNQAILAYRACALSTRKHCGTPVSSWRAARLALPSKPAPVGHWAKIGAMPLVFPRTIEATLGVFPLMDKLRKVDLTVYASLLWPRGQA